MLYSHLTDSEMVYGSKPRSAQLSPQASALQLTCINFFEKADRGVSLQEVEI